MSSLRDHLDDYLRIRRALGFRLHDHGTLLSDFLDDLERDGVDHVTIARALAWATKPTDVQPYTWKIRLSMVRGLAAYLRTRDPATEVPASDLLGYRYARPRPYRYSPQDIEQLLAAAGGVAPTWRGLTYQSLFGLLAVAGLRIGEAIRLDGDDVELRAGLLTVRDTKFQKSRRIPLHPSAVAALARYAEQRTQRFPRPRTPSFFVTVRGVRLLYTHVNADFLEIVRRARLRPRSTSGPPRIHGLRHSFAVRTLVKWYRSDVDVGANLPLLSAYLGHVSPLSTYWYLEAAPELLALVSQRLRGVVEDL